MPQGEALARGYLRENFRLFHLRDADMQAIDWHYHSFHKVVAFLAGHASYAIEGKSYVLEPGDMVLVPRGCIHRPEVRPGLPYERYILYIAPEFLRQISSAESDLEQCFGAVAADYQYALRPAGPDTAAIRLLETLQSAMQEPGFGQDLLTESLLVQFLVRISRDLAAHQLRYVTSAQCDEKVVAILRYLNLHLTEPISTEELSRQFYVSKYHMMRRFKAETGYTIHSYVTEKRLLLAREKIARGGSLGQISEECGFGDYSTFSRAYKRQFGVSPNAVGKPATLAQDDILD